MVTEPSLPTSDFYCYVGVYCTLSIGSYTNNYAGCTYVYDIIDTDLLAATTLSLLITDTSNTISLSITPISSEIGYHNLKI